MDNTCSNKSTLPKIYSTDRMVLDDDIIKKLKNYSLETYLSDVKTYGLEITWNNICQFVIDNYNNLPNFLNINNFGELYEIGLAIWNKQLKKDSGQYYTPDDVASVMCEWLEKCNGENVCDVGCGTGKLILTYLDLIGNEQAVKLISSGKLYLYDFDNIALKICRTSIAVKYGLNLAEKINDIYCDFLDKNIKLPENCKVISNPPYSQINEILNNWEHTEVAIKTKEYYALFIEKILNQSNSSVIISPYSFISGTKFYPLRTLMNNSTGFIVSFDNVPGNIFCGRKHGIFNTNTANSVRAAITVSMNDTKDKGYRLTPLIRFKQTERANLLKCNVLEEFLESALQTANKANPMFYKCHKQLKHIFDKWIKISQGWVLSDYTRVNGDYTIYMPNTCRYYTTASNKLLNRSGQITLNFHDENIFNYVFCLINSSFAYWYWRIYDGGITYPKNLLLSIPVFYEILSDNDKLFFNKITKEMIKNSKDYIVTKNNVGTQENIKYPKEYRDKINTKFLEILRLNDNYEIFDIIHSNKALEIFQKHV